MNINPTAAASVAGTGRAAARGGESDNQAIESTRAQSTADKPAGSSTDSNAVDAGDQTDDRGGNGQQTLDVFERAEQSDPSSDENSGQRKSASPSGTGENLDLQA